MELVETRAEPPERVAPEYTSTVLLVEDDDGDALIVTDLLEMSAPELEVRRAKTIGDALGRMGGVSCVLLDLGLPDSTGLAGLARLLDAAPALAVLVLTGLSDAPRGEAAVAAGAQDYLVKDEIDGELLVRAIRYAIERKRADETRAKLMAAQLRSIENNRLERHLLPLPFLKSGDIEVVTRYRPGRDGILGGDFYDTVECEDGRIFAVIGDVAGHGPDEAALGVALRIAWRTLVIAPNVHAERVLPTLQRVLASERRRPEVFATACMVEVDAHRDRARIWLAGHPEPLLLAKDKVVPVGGDARGPAIGVMPDQQWLAADVALEEGEALMLYTDGLVEECLAGQRARLGDDGLLALVTELRRTQSGLEALVEDLLAEVHRLTNGSVHDDRAVMVLGRSLPR